MSDTATDSRLRDILVQCRTLAVVGLSPQPERPSHQASQYMQRHGYRIVPVNPVVAREGGSILGEPVHASLADAAAALDAQGLRIDMVDCFRKSEDIPPLAAEAVAVGARCLWLQLGVVNDKALELARAAGLWTVQDRCVKIEYQRLLADAPPTARKLSNCQLKSPHPLSGGGLQLAWTKARSVRCRLPASVRVSASAHIQHHARSL